MKKIILLVVLLGCVGAVSWWVFVPSDVERIGVDYKNAEYEIENSAVVLKNGISEILITPESQAVVTTRYFGNEARGDLNADGVEDVAFLLTQEAGGTATFFYAVAALSIPGTPERVVGTNGIFLGDRIAPQTTEIRDGVIVVNYAARTADAAFTDSPSLGVTKRIRVENNRLIEI